MTLLKKHKELVNEQEEKHKKKLDEMKVQHQKALESREAEIKEMHEKIQILREIKLQDKMKDLELKNSEHHPTSSSVPSQLVSLTGKRVEANVEPKDEAEHKQSTSHNVRAKKRKFKWPFKGKVYQKKGKSMTQLHSVMAQ